ncbi:MAG: spermidine/putrescine ABC transporter substrate-binding protein [Defluviitaleaceae bacterium]|nr:spermidine/putrescine ABC transporter substrate-binding protein [Defluviitaleaceae bacterium]MCL2837255.1 spermidine/putrescine ABC transporter substrate-binding protein [Defluviitaleaceae bacterium]
MRRILLCVLCVVLLAGSATVLSGCGERADEVIYFYNWMEFIDPDVLELFKEETGISVIMDTFESNESMYVTIAHSGGYDVIVPSDYMVERMRNEGLLEKIDMDKIPNFKHIDQRFHNKPYDPDMEYTVPYMWGTVGIIYDTSRVYEPVTSWGALWDPRYAGEIFMYDSIRDTMSIALKRLGYSLNTTDLDELNRAIVILREQMPLVQAYLGEPVKDKMIAGEGILAVMYSGDALYCMLYNENLNYVVPIEGSNIWMDGLSIPANARNKEGALKFIDFLSRPEIAAMNSEWIGYTTANKTALDLIDPELRDHPVFWPPDDVIARCEYHADLGDFRAEYVRAMDQVFIGQ